MEKSLKDLIMRANGTFLVKQRGTRTLDKYSKITGIHSKTLNRRETGFFDISVFFDYSIDDNELIDHFRYIYKTVNEHK
jgi:hypothetical protein